MKEVRREGGQEEEEEKRRKRRRSTSPINIIRIDVILLFRLVCEPGELHSLLQRSDPLILEIFNVASPWRQK